MQLEFYRKYRGYSREELAEYLSLPPTSVTNLENGFCEIYYEDAEKLAKFLDIDIELLLDDYIKFMKFGYGKKISEIRKSLGYSQAKFAEMLGVGRATVSVWEAEWNKHRPTRKNFEKLMQLSKMATGGDIEDDT